MTVSARPRRHLGSRPKGSVQTLDTLRSRLTSARATGMTWRQIAAHFDGVPAGTLCAIAKGRDPKSPAIRSALGLPAYASAPVCPVHGVVHAGRCPRRKTFEQNAAEYQAWKARNLPKLLKIVAWAEGKR